MTANRTTEAAGAPPSGADDPRHLLALVPHEVHRRRPGTPGARVRRSWSRPEPALVTDLEKYSTGVIADAMHRLGAMDGGIQAAWAGARLAGPALTTWVRAGDNARIHEAIALANPGDVLVVNAQGSLAHAVFGELMALSCVARGVAGIVVDGAIRDTAALAAGRFPTFARGACASGPLKDGTGEIGFSIACGGVACNPGDVVVADGDGVVVVPLADVVTVLERAREIADWEQQCHADLAARPAPRRDPATP